MPEVFILLAAIFWLAMIVDCVYTEPDRATWLWILLLLSVTGAVLYFVFRKLPQRQIPLPPFFQRWRLQSQIWTAEANVRNIGKAHQYILLGNLLSEAGQLNRANEAFLQALQQEPNNVQAHWGLARNAFVSKQLAIAQTHFRLLLQQDPDYKCGEASLLYGKVLFQLGDWNLARPHLEQDLKQWGHPEAALMLAKILIAQGNGEAAHTHLKTLLVNLKAAPDFHRRRHETVIRQAQKLSKLTRSFVS